MGCSFTREDVSWQQSGNKNNNNCTNCKGLDTSMKNPSIIALFTDTAKIAKTVTAVKVFIRPFVSNNVSAAS